MTASSYASDAKIIEALAILGADFIGQTEQTLLQQLVVAAALGGGGGGGASAWGSITGTLSAQTDLQTALDAKLNLTGGTLTGQLINSTNGAASTPPVLLSGTIFTGGSATTTKPQHLIEPTGTTSTSWSTSGTLYGGNAPAGFTGNLFDFQIDGVSRLRLSGTVLLPGASGGTDLGQYNMGFGTVRARNVFVESGSGNRGFALVQDFGVQAGSEGWIGFSSVAATGANWDAFFTRAAAATIQMGSNHATTATHQTFKAHDVTTGAGADLFLQGGAGSANDGYVKIGTATGGLAFFGASGSPLISGNINTNISSGGVGSALLDDTQSDGGLGGGAYTFGGLVAALKSYGIIG